MNAVPMASAMVVSVSEAAPATALGHFLQPLREAGLDDESVTELCIQQPGEAWIERREGEPAGTSASAGAAGWSRVALPFATLLWCQSLARLIATASRQRLDAERPLLSASIPGTGERVQIVLPPATLPGVVVVSIRKPSSVEWSLAELTSKGVFRRVARRASTNAADLDGAGGSGIPSVRDGAGVGRYGSESELLNGSGSGRAGAESAHAVLSAHWRTGRIDAFLECAVRARLNLLVSGATASGKTTLTRALIQAIPVGERLVAIEDAGELLLPQHPNAVRLFYSRGGEAQGQAKGVTATSLLEASLRLRPDRILLAELRGEEAYPYLRNVSSGHPGSITSIHAGSCEGAFEQLVLLVKESAAGRTLSAEEIREMARSLVDVVVQCETRDGERRVRDVWWRDAPG